MTRTPSSPQYLELSSSVTFIWLFIVTEAGLVWLLRQKTKQVFFSLPFYWKMRIVWHFFFCCREAISLFLIVLFLHWHFAGEFSLSADYSTAFFFIKRKRAVIKCNAFQMITQGSFIYEMCCFILSDWGSNWLNGANISHEGSKNNFFFKCIFAFLPNRY